MRALARPGLARRVVGDLGEELAARALSRAGYVLVGRNVAAPEAELDAVALAGPVTVVVEVKCGVVRGSAPGAPGAPGAADAGAPSGAAGASEDVEGRSRPRRFRPADHVLAEDVLVRRRAARRIAARGAPWRVDVVEVTVRVGEEGARLELAHFVDVTGERPWPWEPAPRGSANGSES